MNDLTTDYIKLASKGYTLEGFIKYIEDCGGIDKLKKKNLDRIINECREPMLKTSAHLNNEYFMNIYKMVSDNRSAKIMKIWTWIAGISSVISTIVSIISLYRPK